MRRRLTSEKRSRSCAFTLPKLRERSRAFTLLELLVVIGIISILLVAVIPAINLTKSSGRKGAISNLLGAIEQARAEAIKTGQATYIVFPTFTIASQTTLDRYNYKSYAIFEDDPTTNPISQKQLTNWKTLPTGVAIRSKAGSSESITNLASTSTMFAFTPEAGTTAAFYYIKFNANGEVELPPVPPSNITLAVFEGFVDPTSAEVVTSTKDATGEPAARESITIARLTGRAERVP